jgi:phage-related protein
MKDLFFCGPSRDDLKEFSPSARREAGYQLDLVQLGLKPSDWKPMHAIGRGVEEIRIRDETGAWRVIYVARFSEAVFVLHCLSKKSQKTAKSDIELAAARYRELARRLEK